MEVGEDSYMEMDTAQIKGVDSTVAYNGKTWQRGNYKSYGKTYDTWGADGQKAALLWI